MNTQRKSVTNKLFQTLSKQHATEHPDNLVTSLIKLRDAEHGVETLLNLQFRKWFCGSEHERNVTEDTLMYQNWWPNKGHINHDLNTEL